METFETLYAANRVAVERCVRYRIETRADADDVAQEIWLAAFRDFGKLKSPDSFKPWVLGIARHKIADYYRSRLGAPKLEELDESALSFSFSPPEPTLVEEALEKLPAQDRRLLRWRYWDGMPLDAMASALGVPVGTVKSRLHASRQSIKKNYPCPRKGDERMQKKLPEILPKYTITPLDQPPFPVKWEELMGWFLVPKMGERLTWAIYDQPTGKMDLKYDMKTTGRAEVHGIEGVELTAVESRYDGTDAEERRFVAQLTDTHCRFLASSHEEDGVKRLVTFLDGDAFTPNWGFGEDNCGNETNLSAKGDIRREGSLISCADKKFLLDITGRYEVSILSKRWDTVCVMDVETYNSGVVSEQYLDKNGRTVLWRRFNRLDWAFDRYRKLWTEMLPENEVLIVNGVKYVHWYDCITDYIL